MRRTLLTLLLCVLACDAFAGPQSVVLIARADSTVGDLDSLTVRKLFLGQPVMNNGALLHALRNRSDPLLDAVFLQDIVAMSQSVYDRQTLVGLNRQGTLRPVEITSDARLFDALYADANAVSFARLQDVIHNPKIRVIRVLWSE